VCDKLKDIYGFAFIKKLVNSSVFRATIFY